MHRVDVRDPVRFGGKPFGINVFNSTVTLFDSIAEHVFGPGRSDATTAQQYDYKVPSRGVLPVRARTAIGTWIRASDHGTHSRKRCSDPSSDARSGPIDIA